MSCSNDTYQRRSRRIRENTATKRDEQGLPWLSSLSYHGLHVLVRKDEVLRCSKKEIRQDEMNSREITLPLPTRQCHLTRCHNTVCLQPVGLQWHQFLKDSNIFILILRYTINLEKKKHHEFLRLWVVKRGDFVSPNYTLYTYSKGASGKYCLLRDRVIMTGVTLGVTPRFGQRHGKDFRAKMTGIFQL